MLDDPVYSSSYISCGTGRRPKQRLAIYVDIAGVCHVNVAEQVELILAVNGNKATPRIDNISTGISSKDVAKVGTIEALVIPTLAKDTAWNRTGGGTVKSVGSTELGVENVSHGDVQVRGRIS
jgi:hypothetical protein